MQSKKNISKPVKEAVNIQQTKQEWLNSLQDVKDITEDQLFEIFQKAFPEECSRIGKLNSWSLWTAPDQKSIGVIIGYKFCNGFELGKFYFYSQFFVFRERQMAFTPHGQPLSMKSLNQDDTKMCLKFIIQSEK